MSKVVITVDTVAKTVVCNIDGEEFVGPKHVSINAFEFLSEGKVDREVFLSIEAGSEPAGDNLSRFTRVVTASSKLGKEAIAANIGEVSEDRTLVTYQENSKALEESAMKWLDNSISEAKEEKNKKKTSKIY